MNVKSLGVLANDDIRNNSIEEVSDNTPLDFITTLLDELEGKLRIEIGEGGFVRLYLLSFRSRDSNILKTDIDGLKGAIRPHLLEHLDIQPASTYDETHILAHLLYVTTCNPQFRLGENRVGEDDTTGMFFYAIMNNLAKITAEIFTFGLYVESLPSLARI